MEGELLLVLDMQKAILRKPIHERGRLIKNINALIDTFSSSGSPVVLSRHTNKSLLIPQSDGWRVDDSIRVPPNVIMFNKRRSNIFEEAGFNQMLLDKGIRRLYVCGLVSNGCVQAACSEGVKQGFTVILPGDAHSTYVKDAGAVIEKWNTKLPECGVRIISTAEVIRRVQSQ
ncbi:MAG: cysteine hydrolase [Propionibacteriaceae bacterium]|jgi:nicotinamidase-related amidase|nr:cysteine hydrolase [Propionibacteriaceae bacterium]